MPLINLQQFDTSINSRASEGNVYSGGDAKIWDAVSGLGDRALNIFSNIAVEQRKNDIKQSAFNVYDSFTVNLKKEMLSAKGRTDVNGKIVQLDQDGNWKRQDGNVVYEVDGLGNPISYSNYVAQKLNELNQKSLDTFNGDTDKQNYFNDLANTEIRNTLLSSVIAENEMVEKSTYDAASESYNKGLSTVINYQQPDFMGIADFEFDKASKRNKETLEPINGISSNALEKKALKSFGETLSDKWLLHAQTEIGKADQGLTEFVGLSVAFDPELKGYTIGMLSDRYDTSVGKQALREWATSLRDMASKKIVLLEKKLADLYGKKISIDVKDSEEVLSFEDIDIKGSLPEDKQQIEEMVKAELLKPSKFFEALEPSQKQDFIEKILSIKIKDSGNRIADFKGQVDNLVAYPGLRAGRGSMSYVQENLAIRYKMPAWKEAYTPNDTITIGFNAFKNQSESLIADSILINKGITSLPNIVTQQKIKAKKFIKEFTNNDPVIADRLEWKETGSTVMAPFERELLKKAESLTAEYRSNPKAFAFKYDKSIQELEKKAVFNNDPVAQEKLQKQLNNYYTRQGIVGYEENSPVSSAAVNQKLDSINGALDQGKFIQAADSLLSLNKMGKSYQISMLKQLKDKGLNSASIGAMVFGMFGEVDEEVQRTSTAENLVRVTPKRIAETNKSFSALFESFDDAKSVEDEIRSYVNSSLNESLPSIYANGKDSNSAAMAGYITDYVTNEIKERYITNPTMDIEEEVSKIIKEKTSKVTDYSSEASDVKGVFRNKNIDAETMVERQDQIKENILNEILSGKTKVELEALPTSFKEYLKAVGKDKAPLKDKMEEFKKRYNLVFHSTSPIGDSTDAEVHISDGTYTTPLKIKNSEVSDPQKYIIKGFAE